MAERKLEIVCTHQLQCVKPVIIVLEFGVSSHMHAFLKLLQETIIFYEIVNRLTTVPVLVLMPFCFASKWLLVTVVTMD